MAAVGRHVRFDRSRACHTGRSLGRPGTPDSALLVAVHCEQKAQGAAVLVYAGPGQLVQHNDSIDDMVDFALSHNTSIPTLSQSSVPKRMALATWVILLELRHL